MYNFVQKKQELDENSILQIHKIILKNISDADAGHYRNANVRIMGAVHLPPSAIKIPALMAEFMEWYYENEAKLSIVELAAWVHYNIVYIHPFVDGNGRTARLLMNLILLQNGYPPAVILNMDRKKYYRVLMEADKGKYNNYLDFIGRSVERSLLIYLNTFKSQKASLAHDPEDKYGYINLKQAAALCEYSMEYLSYLSRTGRLKSVKVNRNWLTTREALQDYINGLEKKL